LGLANRGMGREAIFALIRFSGFQGNALAALGVQASALKRRTELKVSFECGGRIGHDPYHVGYQAKLSDNRLRAFLLASSGGMIGRRAIVNLLHLRSLNFADAHV